MSDQTSHHEEKGETRSTVTSVQATEPTNQYFISYHICSSQEQQFVNFIILLFPLIFITLNVYLIKLHCQL